MRYRYNSTWSRFAVVCSVTVACTALLGASEQAHGNSCAVKIVGGKGTENVETVARRNRFRSLGKIGNLEDVYLFKEDEPGAVELEPSTAGSDVQREEQLRAEPNVTFVMHQKVQKRAKRSYFPPTDPQWGKQWSLSNSGQVGGTHDLNVEPAWIQGFTGKGVTVAVVDDGLWYTHPDLAPNFNAAVSIDFLDEDDDIMPERSRDNHGTSCAGIIAMAKSNGVCGVGVAYDSQIAGLRLLSQDETTDASEARALGFRTDVIDIYSNSWGPYDDGFVVDGPGPLLNAVMEKGTREGRGGKGTIYVWAAGNGGMNGDSCAMDGYVSSIYTIAVGSVDQYGHQAPYDEDCSSKLAVTFNHNVNSRNRDHITTTDVRDNCRENFRGTSAACPMVSGAIALALEANHNLTWRDVQYLIVHTSKHEGLTSSRGQAWERNGAGLWVSNSFGFGAIDVEALVTRARHWVTVPEQRTSSYKPDIGAGVVSVNNTLNITFVVENDTELRSLEHTVVSLSLSIENYTQARLYAQYQLMQSLIGAYYGQIDINDLISHTGARRGDITITITSPHGTVSLLLPTRERDFVNADELSWSFMSVLHWGEDPRGEWVLLVNFQSNEGYVQVRDLNVTFYGVASPVEAVSGGCSPECKGGCAAIGTAYCDACQLYRNAETLHCMDNCTEEFELHHNYCIQVSPDDYSTKSSLPMPTPTAQNNISATTYSEAVAMSSYSDLPLSRSDLSTTALTISKPFTITHLPTEEMQLMPTSPPTLIPSPSISLTPSLSSLFLSPSPHSVSDMHITRASQSNRHPTSSSTILPTLPLKTTSQASHTHPASPTLQAMASTTAGYESSSPPVPPSSLTLNGACFILFLIINVLPSNIFI